MPSQSSVSRKKGPARGCLIAIAIVAVLLAIPFGFIAYLRVARSPWPAAPAGVRLAVQTPSVALSELTEADAQFHLLTITNALKRSNDFQIEYNRLMAWGRKGWPYPALAETCANSGDHLMALDSAARAPSNHWHFPAEWYAATPWLGLSLNYAKLNAYRAGAADLQGPDGAGDPFRRLSFELSARLMPQGMIIQHLVGLAMAGVAATELGDSILGDPPPSPERLRRWIEELPRYEPAPETFSETMRYEYMWASNVVDYMFSSSKDSQGIVGLLSSDEKPPDFDRLLRFRPLLWLVGSTPRRVHDHVARVYAHMVDLSTRPYEPGAADQFIEQHFEKNRRRFMCDDPLGALILAMMVPAMDASRARHLESVALIRATRVMCALRLYQMDHGGRWPAELSDLLPGYLAELPADPFSAAGDGFGYRTDPGDGFVLWSRGRDTRDDGGEPTMEDPGKAKDCVYGPSAIRLKREKFARDAESAATKGS